MKKILFNIFCVFHIGVIICVAVYSSYLVNCEYHLKPKSNTFFNFFGKCIANNPMRHYIRYTGTETGYGFFAPSVRSSGVIVSEINGRKLVPKFRSFEAQIRYSGLSGDILDDMFTQKDTLNNYPKQYLETKSKYYDLLYQNIALKLINEYAYKADTAIICYNLVVYPTLKEIKKGKKTNPALYKIKELKFSITQ